MHWLSESKQIALDNRPELMSSPLIQLIYIYCVKTVFEQKFNFSDDEPIPATIAVESLMDVTEEDVAGLLGFELGNPQLTQFSLMQFPLT